MDDGGWWCGCHNLPSTYYNTHMMIDALFAELDNVDL